MSTLDSNLTPAIYQGQFGTFTITERDRQGVIVYRSALMVAAVSLAIATLLVLFPSGASQSPSPRVLSLITWLYITFSLGLGIALSTIHIYMIILHRALQVFWAIGSASAIGFSLYYREPIGSIVYMHPLTILGVGFTFAALTGIFFKEAFCFNRFETKILTFLVPILLLGHLTNLLTLNIEAFLLSIWAALFFIFASRKAIQAIPDDIGDKSVFEHLEKQK